MTHLSSDEAMEKITELLNEAQAILTKDLPDMSIQEFNETPIGRAVSRIAEALELLTED